MTNASRWTRRDFLRASAAAAAIPAFVPGSALGLDGGSPASETIRVGLIGCGNRCADVIREGAGVKGFQVVAACDCQVEKAERYVKELGHHVPMAGGKPWQAYADFRKMIDREKLDAVMIETTTHARAWIAILAMQAGMHAYIEKPMALTVSEGRAMVRAARKFQRVTQVGTQQRSMPINNWASDLVKNGGIGKVLTVLAPNFIGPIRWTKSSTKDIKQPVAPWWDVWTNQTELRPYSGELHHGWGTWWDYDGGGNCFGVTGWGAHSYDQVNRALGTDGTGPVSLVLEEAVADRDSGKFAPRTSVGGVVLGDTGDVDTGTDYHKMARLSGPRAKVTMKFAGGAELRLHLDGDRGPGLGAIFSGEKGKIEINRNKLASNPRELVRSSDNPGPNRRPETTYHIENWIECIKSSKPCNADIEIGHRANTLCCLVNIVREIGRVGEPLHWDPVAERFTNNDDANKRLSRPRREGYELPEVG